MNSSEAQEPKYAAKEEDDWLTQLFEIVVREHP